jgi:S1-C subfamily serine protease
VADLVEKTVALVTEREDGSLRAYCSGTWLTPTTILTAHHCLADQPLGHIVKYATRGDVTAPDGVSEAPVMLARWSRVADRDVAHDLAVLETVGEVPAHRVARLASSVVGERVQTMGHPIGLWYSYSSGVVSAQRLIKVGAIVAVLVQTTAAISPGNSGGALFNAEGDVVGICHGTFPRGQTLNVFIASSYARLLLGVPA